MSTELLHPSRIGPYEVVRALGHGGSGTVYLVRQEEPIRRQAALKLLRLGMHSPEMFARFDLERRVLAMMDHPNIAKVLDVGSTERTGPYIVMEYVDGVPITKYCDAHRLSVPERLRLFATVCRAMQHAHGRGILHRDVKPSNILVAEREGKAEPVIIDFGLARATAREGEARADLTRHGQPLGTPQYMSPEQLELRPEEIDARTDVYSLGVLLFELVVGVLPHDRKFSPYRPETLVDSVRREESTKPSSKFSALAAEAIEIASARHTSRELLLRQIRGDLDWILSMALEKDRERRYATASELAHDVERYLAREPIVARPPTSAYRLERFVARNRLSLGVAAALLLAMVVGSAASTSWYLGAGRSWREKGEITRVCQAVRTDVANAHLWFEEALAEDATLEVERDVREPLREAQRRLSAEAAPLDRLESPAAQEKLRTLCARLATLDAITAERWEKRADEGRTGGALDQRYDAVYSEVQTLCTDIVQELERSGLQGWRRSAEISLLVNGLALVVLAFALGLGFRIWRKRF